MAIDHGIETVIKPAPELSGKNILRRFEIFPWRWTGVEVILEINNYDYIRSSTPCLNQIHEADEVDCRAFDLNIGEAIYTSCYVHDFNKNFLFFADNEKAYAFIDTDFCAKFTILGETRCYLEPSKNELVLAVKIEKVINIERAEEPFLGEKIPF